MCHCVPIILHFLYMGPVRIRMSSKPQLQMYGWAGNQRQLNCREETAYLDSVSDDEIPQKGPRKVTKGQTILSLSQQWMLIVDRPAVNYTLVVQSC